MLWFVIALALRALVLYLVASLVLKLATHVINRHRAAAVQPSGDSATTAQ